MVTPLMIFSQNGAERRAFVNQLRGGSVAYTLFVRVVCDGELKSWLEVDAMVSDEV
ncbi:hypothetical protein HW561_06115 [Rhodobacteraceae bacterium B1Z28]|uniref:Uncharacterized protein n=1 Tax=Ruegeria haliotis TaxID=2747601 RepID=A0ABX2PML2_9RHOB|nr:hypothetical protein [Ruegeria haliotis]NVO55362.1 hypothetical protein [Ruegeria haliotis]